MDEPAQDRSLGELGQRVAGLAQLDPLALDAADGTIEAIEDPRHPFLLGVQWHAETLIDLPCQLALFEALVVAASWRSRAVASAA